MPVLAKAAPALPPHTPLAKSGAVAGAGPFSLPSSIPPRQQPHGTFAPTRSDTLDGLAHDARNVMSGLMLYCELLSTPGVLNENHGHYAQDLESIVSRANRMLEKLAQTATASQPLPAGTSTPISAVPITDAAEELRHAQPLLAAIAGPAIKLSIATMPCAGQTALAVEDLTRVLVNLVRNAADAMPSGGRIRITAQFDDSTAATPSHILLTVTDNGPGIPESLRAQIFALGFTTRRQAGWPSPRRRGLGLSIVRNLVEAAGGSVTALAAPGAGARFEIRLPLVDVTSGMCAGQPQSGFAADARGKGCIECH